MTQITAEHDAVVVDQLRGRFRCPVLFQIGITGHEMAHPAGELSRDQARVDEMSNTNCDIKALFDDVDDAVGADEFELNVGVAIEIVGADGREEMGVEWRADSQQTARRFLERENRLLGRLNFGDGASCV